MKKNSKKSYKALRDTWYAKLADQGFKDIEWEQNPDSRYLRGRPKRIDVAVYQNKQDYYIMAQRYLSNHRLRGQARFIWKCHAHGMTYDDIVPAFKEKFGVAISVFKVYYWIEELAKKAEAWHKRQGSRK